MKRLSVFILFFVTYGYFFQGGGWNQNSRICLTRAIIHQHAFHIDAYKEDSLNPAFEFVNTGDWAYRNGHYYTNKSPGLSFMAVVPFGITEYVLSRIIPHDQEAQVLISTYVSTLCTVVLCASLLCVLLFSVFRRFFGLSDRAALIMTVFFGFGTTAFSYSTTFYCHLPAAFFGFLSFVPAVLIRHGKTRKPDAAVLFSGAAASAAVLIEPSAVFILAAVFVYLVSVREGRKRAFWFLLGCVPAGGAQLWYNTVCFGGPLSSSYQFANDMVMWYSSGSLFGLPDPRRMIQMLVSPYRGLFFCAPVMLMILPGLYYMYTRRTLVAEGLVCACAAAAFFVFISAFHAWHGGSAVGPRYLLPAFPFAYVLAVYAWPKLPKSFVVLGAVSVLINLSITAVGNEIPRQVHNPIGEVILPNILRGNVSINPVPVSHFHHYPSIYKLEKIEHWMPNFNSFNLGEIIFPHSLLSILPLFAFWIVWLWRFRKGCGRRSVLSGAG